MTRVGTRPRAAPLYRRPGAISRVVLAAIAIPLLFLGTSLLDLPHLVPKLVAVNPDVYQVNVEVGQPGHAEWLDLGTLDRESTKSLEEVVDQGPNWVFRFSYGRMAAGELAISRAQLKRDGWRFTVPPEVMERLRSAGLAPSAR